MAISNNPKDARGAAFTGGAPGVYPRRPPALSKRLAAVADAVREGSRAADVGCDHGLLAAHLALTGKCPVVYAADLNEAPLAKARALFESLRIAGRCRAVLCDGIEGIAPDSVDDIVIAGLGGDAIMRIIENAAWLRSGGVRLALCPSTRHARLRRGLYAIGFELISERAVCEEGFCYTVMSAGYSGLERDISDGLAAIGLLTGNSPDEAAYRAREARRYERLVRSRADEDKKRRAQSALDYIREVEQK